MRRNLSVPDAELLVRGICMGFGDTAAPANEFRVSKLPIEDFTAFLDVE
jgi:hypothetical protein